MSNFESIINTTNTQFAKYGNSPITGIVHKFGASTITTTMQPITQSGFYRTPTTAADLEISSSSAADGVGGLGLREVKVIGLNSEWAEIEQTVTMNGTTAVALDTPMTRVYRIYGTQTGTYSSATAGSSQVGEITLQETGGGDVWSKIVVSPTAMSQSQIGVYTVPLGKTAFLTNKTIFIDSNKSADLYFFRRDNCDDITAPYTGIRRLIEREVGVQGAFERTYQAPKGPYVGPCDIGFMGIMGTGTAECSVEFELSLIDSI